jgi:peroxiredoxin
VKRIIGGFLALLVFGSAYSAEVPFNLEKFRQSQKQNEKILLLFFADWCPTCKAQKKVLSKLDQEDFLKGLTIYEVNYDQETEFKKEMKVTQQSTFISFYGPAESGRSTGTTNEEEIKKYITTTLTSLTLKDQLRLVREAGMKKMPPEAAKAIESAISKLRDSRLTERALKVGQTMPDFSLKDAHGKTVSLKGMLKKGSVIVTFYRGSWCPFCNAQLSSYQQHLAEFRAKGASLIAITPEKPDLTVLTEQQKKLEFPILTDTDNKLATKFGLVWAIEGDLKKVYKEFGLDLEKNQGNPEWKLPIPATYVVGPNGKIKFAFLDVDYTRRAEPADILTALEE